MKRSHPDTSDPGSRPWWASGLRFACQPDCGACCTSHGEYAYVYLEPPDAGRLARFLGLSEEEFAKQHLGSDDGAPILDMRGGTSCPFLAGSRCTVYEARPTQCRTFPFWRENLRSPATWRALARVCPGIDRGEQHAAGVIDEQLAARRTES